MPLIKREFYISCKGEECFKLAELIQENITISEMAVDIGSDGLFITLYGYKTDVKNAWAKIRWLVRRYREAVKRVSGGYKISIDYIVSSIRRTFPPLLLVEILKRMGYEARYIDGSIETNTDLEKVKEIASRIADIMDEIRFDTRSTTCKYFIVAASILSGKEPSMVIEESIESGLLYRDQDDKLKLRIEWRQALDKYLRGETISQEDDLLL